MQNYIKGLQKVENHWLKKKVGIGSLLGSMNLTAITLILLLL